MVPLPLFSNDHQFYANKKIIVTPLFIESCVFIYLVYYYWSVNL